MLSSFSHVRLFATPWTAAHQASLSFTISQSLLKFMSIESVMPSNHLILCRPFLLLPSIFPSIRVFSKESVLHIRWPKYWSFSFSISPSNDYSGLISFRIDWFDLLAVQGTLKGFLLHHSSKASILWHSVFFMVQRSHGNGNPTLVLLPGKSHVHGVAESRTRLSDITFTFHFHALEKEMATHSSVLAWRIPGTGEPGGLPSLG